MGRLLRQTPVPDSCSHHLKNGRMATLPHSAGKPERGRRPGTTPGAWHTAGDPPPSVQGDHIPVSSQCFIHRPGDSDGRDPMRQRGGAREVVSVEGGPLSTLIWLASGLQGAIHLQPDLSEL